MDRSCRCSSCGVDGDGVGAGGGGGVDADNAGEDGGDEGGVRELALVLDTELADARVYYWGKATKASQLVFLWGCQWDTNALVLLDVESANARALVCVCASAREP